MDPITRTLMDHYAETFRQHGPSSRGVDWRAEGDLLLRYDKMLAVVSAGAASSRTSLLDVGCGFGGLYGYVQSKGLPIQYTGVDVVQDMVDHARRTWPTADFRCVDAFQLPPESEFDFVVCNGILTQKLSASIRDMDRFAQRLIRRMFDLAVVGVAFNVMTSRVDYTKDNLYHRHPAELMAWCMAELTDKVRIDHAYPLYEYTVYLYREGVA